MRSFSVCAALLLASACGTNGGGSGGGPADVPRDAGAADDGGSPGDASTSRDGGFPSLARCALGTVTELPYPDTILPQTFPADRQGMAFGLWPGLSGPPGTVIGSSTLDGAFTALATVPAGNEMGVLGLDSSSVYFTLVPTSASAGPTLSAVPRNGGTVSALLTLPALSHLDAFAVGPSALYLTFYGPTPTADAIFALPKTGGTLGPALYTAPDGAFIGDLSMDGATLFWTEISQSGAFLIRSASTSDAAFTPRTWGTLPPPEMGARVNVVAAQGVVLFALVRMPFPPGGPEARRSPLATPDAAVDAAPPPPFDAGALLPLGAYALGPDGAPILVDATSLSALVRGDGASFYRVPSGLRRVAWGQAVPTPVDVPTFPATSDAFAIGGGNRVFFTQGGTSCIYEAK